MSLLCDDKACLTFVPEVPTSLVLTDSFVLSRKWSFLSDQLDPFRLNIAKLTPFRSFHGVWNQATIGA